MQRIGVLYNPFSEPSTRVSVEIAEWLRGRGIEVWRGVSHEGRDEPQVLEGLDLLVALGGDGTVLRAARLAIQRSIPVLPVALVVLQTLTMRLERGCMRSHLNAYLHSP